MDRLLLSRLMIMASATQSTSSTPERFPGPPVQRGMHVQHTVKKTAGMRFNPCVITPAGRVAQSPSSGTRQAPVASTSRREMDNASKTLANFFHIALFDIHVRRSSPKRRLSGMIQNIIPYQTRQEKKPDGINMWSAANKDEKYRFSLAMNVPFPYNGCRLACCGYARRASTKEAFPWGRYTSSIIR